MRPERGTTMTDGPLRRRTRGGTMTAPGTAPKPRWTMSGSEVILGQLGADPDAEVPWFALAWGFAIALGVVLLRGVPRLRRLLVPYHAAGMPLRAGFIPLQHVLNGIPSYRLFVTHRVIVPLLATTTSVLTLVIMGFADAPDLGVVYVSAGVSLLMLLGPGPGIGIVALLGGAYGLAYLVWRTAFAGVVLSVIVTSLVFAALFQEHQTLRRLIVEQELVTARGLDGKPLRRPGRAWKALCHRLGRFEPTVWLLLLAGCIYTLASGRDIGDLLPTVTSPELQALALLAIGLFANISLNIFGGVFDYLQLDLFSLLAQEVSDAGGDHREAAGEPSRTRASSLRLPAENDVLPPLSPEWLPRYAIAFLFFAADLLLTVAAVYQIPLAPGLTGVDSIIIAAAFKVPVYVHFLTGAGLEQLRRRHNQGKTHWDSVTATEEFEYANAVERGFQELLAAVQVHRVGGRPYVDLHPAMFMIWREDDTNKRIHL
jgi:hypothetical protein